MPSASGAQPAGVYRRVDPRCRGTKDTAAGAACSLTPLEYVRQMTESHPGLEAKGKRRNRSTTPPR
ncbi:hypothetical protein EYF80_049637 [Liparis tanakae]|uniref:Uncharacterized protein n=1 Tax=Liparis tanakae TaxID=230148 RepID=A0A4Z2FG70_9TELE|nr:hypothetical protein EYF80_049637 [Liparis tanakae]